MTRSLHSTRRRRLLGGAGALAILGAPPWALAADDTYDQESTLKAATDFFGSTTEGLAKVVEKAFREQGRPNGYLRGEEVSAAVTVGLRYGEGELAMKNGTMGTRRLVARWNAPLLK